MNHGRSELGSISIVELLFLASKSGCNSLTSSLIPKFLCSVDTKL